MSKSFEENTKDFYKELNGKCDPKRLLFIAEQGIFLKEPLFNYDKIKDHEFVVDISIINNQFFLINNDKQYNRLKYFKDYQLVSNVHTSEYYENGIFSLIIINKFFIDKLLSEKDEDFIRKIREANEIEFYLLYLYNYSHIYTKTFILFFPNNYDEYIIPDIKFEIFKYFYSNTHKYLLDDFVKMNENNMINIIKKIIEKYGKDINILNYCLDIIKQYNLEIKSIYGYRVPMNHSFEVLKYYSDKICIRNKLYFKCQDKTVEKFINICFSDSNIENFQFFSSDYIQQLSKRYNIDFCKIVSEFKVIKNDDDDNDNNKDDNDNNKDDKNNNKDDNDNNKDDNDDDNDNNKDDNDKGDDDNDNNKDDNDKGDDDNDNNKDDNDKGDDDKDESYYRGYKYKHNTKSKLIKIIDPQYNRKLSYVDSYILNPGDINYNFVNLYLKNYKKIDRILKDPNYILSLNLDFDNYTECLIIKLCYLVSLIHNNCSKFLIYILIYYDDYWHDIRYIKNKIVYMERNYSKYKCSYYIYKIFKILMNTPHKVFNSYFYCY